MDLRAGELRKRGLRIRLQAQPLQILGMLLERPGELVTREELRQVLWPGDTFVDFDHGLSNAINRLREALSDSAESPRFVETLPRRGYRFIAPVENIPSPVPHDLAVQVADSSTAPNTPLSDKVDALPAESSNASLLVGGRQWIAAGAAAVALLALLVSLNTGGLRQRLLRASAATRIQSIAVLPLENLSGDPSEEYFADGMTEALITDLGKIGELRVISRTSAMHYKGTRKTLPEIARELNVDAVIEGAVLRSGDRVRITAQLVQAASERHLWAESYERDLQDVLALQSEVAGAIAREVQVKLTPQEQFRLAASRPVNPAAHESYLRAIYSFHQGRNEAEERQIVAFFSKSIEQFQEAIRLDPNYAQAYAGLARAYHWLAGWLSVPQPELVVKSRLAAEQALALDPGLAEAHASLGYLAYAFEWDFPRAERELRRAIDLSPNYEEAHHGLGLYLSAVGRPSEAVSELARSRELDPSNLALQENLGLACSCAGQHDSAIGILQNLLATQTNAAEFHQVLAVAFIEKGEFAQGLEAARRAVQLDGENAFSLVAEIRAEVASGDRPAALRTRRELDSLARRKPLLPTDLALARAHAALGENDRAFERLHAALARREFSVVQLKCDGALRPLRGDPRFSAILKQIGLPE